MNTKFLRSAAILVFSFFIKDLALAQDVSISLISDEVTSVERRFGTEPINSFTLMTLGLSNIEAEKNVAFGVAGIDSYEQPTERYKPRPIYVGPPLVQTKGLVRGNGVLYISDTGKDTHNNGPATIWRLNPFTKELDVFYRGDLLVNSKWLFYLKSRGSKPAQLIISDYGEEPIPRTPGNGIGAKVFSIPILADGSPGEPKILHEGEPFRSPEGVTVVGDTVVLADWAAGEAHSRPEVPDIKFLSGAIFAIPLEGGEPVRLYPDKRFVTLIGACNYSINGRRVIRFIDIDGGRWDDSSLSYLPQSGLPAIYTAPILSEKPLKLGELKLTPISEDTPVSFKIDGVSTQDEIRIIMEKGATFTDGLESKILVSSDLTNDGKTTIVVRSPIISNQIKMEVEVVSDSGVVKSTKKFDVFKPLELSPMMRDNKHGGAIRNVGEPVLHTTADGTTAGVAMFSPNGSIPAILWRGAPFRTPIGTQFSWDGTKLYVTDQNAGPNNTGAVFEIDIPSLAERLAMFPTVEIAE